MKDMLLKKLLVVMLFTQILLPYFHCTPSPKYLSRRKRKNEQRATKVRVEPSVSVKKSIRLSPPVKGFNTDMVVNGFGVSKDPIYGTEEFNSGIDIVINCNELVLCSADGKVAYLGFQNGLGTVVIVDHGGRLCTVYARLDTSFVETGEKILRGNPIGRVMRNVRNGGSCILHYEVRSRGKAVNPLHMLKSF